MKELAQLAVVEEEKKDLAQPAVVEEEKKDGAGNLFK